MSELWDWFEAERVCRGFGCKAKGLSTPQRAAVDRLLKHIRETAKTDHAGAVASQRRHLEHRLRQAESDGQTRQRLGTATPWRSGWWDWWRANVADKPPEQARPGRQQPREVPREVDGKPLTEAEAKAWRDAGGGPPGDWAVQALRGRQIEQAAAANAEKWGRM